MGNLFGPVLQQYEFCILYKLIVYFYFFWGGGGSFDINTLFSYIAKETIDPHYALGVFTQPTWGLFKLFQYYMGGER